MTTYNAMFKYLTMLPDEITFSDTDHFVSQLQSIADLKPGRLPIGPLEVEDMTDQINVYFRRNGRRIKFAVYMA